MGMAEDYDKEITEEEHCRIVLESEEEKKEDEWEYPEDEVDCPADEQRETLTETTQGEALKDDTRSSPGIVSFGDVCVREYALTVGEYGITDDSCPLTLSWEYVQKPARTLEDFEQRFGTRKNGGSRRRYSRNDGPPVLSCNQRRARIAKITGIPLYQLHLIEMERMGSALQTILAEGLNHSFHHLDQTFNNMNQKMRRKEKKEEDASDLLFDRLNQLVA